MKNLHLAVAGAVFCSVGIMTTVAAEPRLVSPEWTYQDDFEGSFKSGFFSSSGPSTTYGQVCPDSQKHNKSLVFKYVPGEPQSGHGWSERRFRIPLKAVQIEMSYDLFIPPNYVPSSGNHKNFIFWSGEYGGSRANMVVNSESWRTSSGGTPSLNIIVDGKNRAHSMVEPRPLYMETRAGKWARIHVLVQLAEKRGSYGKVEVYKDGELLTATDHPGIHTWSSQAVHQHLEYSERGNFLERGYLLGWANGGFSQETVFCVDNFSISANATHGAVSNAPVEIQDLRPDLLDGSVIFREEQ